MLRGTTLGINTAGGVPWIYPEYIVLDNLAMEILSKTRESATPGYLEVNGPKIV